MDYLHMFVSSGLEMFDFHARFYDPQLGRWFTPDPAEQFSNPYLAMANNPVRYTDPNGMYTGIYDYDEDGGGGGGDGGGIIEFEWDVYTGPAGSGGWSSQLNWGANHGSYLLSSSSWLIPYRSREMNEQFLSKKRFEAIYGPQPSKYALNKLLKMIQKLKKSIENYGEQLEYNPYEESFDEYIQKLKTRVQDENIENLEDLARFIENQPWADVLINADTEKKIGEEWPGASIYMAIMKGLTNNRLTGTVTSEEFFGSQYSTSPYYQPEQIYYFGFNSYGNPQLGFLMGNELFIINEFRLDIILKL